MARRPVKLKEPCLVCKTCDPGRTVKVEIRGNEGKIIAIKPVHIKCLNLHINYSAGGNQYLLQRLD